MANVRQISMTLIFPQIKNKYIIKQLPNENDNSRADDSAAAEWWCNLPNDGVCRHDELWLVSQWVLEQFTVGLNKHIALF